MSEAKQKLESSGEKLERPAAPNHANRYADLYAWLVQQAQELRSHRPDFLDWNELAEELDEIVALAGKEALSRLRTVLMHLLKWKYQTANRNELSWKVTIDRERSDLELLLDSKNLHNYIDKEGYRRAYELARREAGNEMQLHRDAWESLFPPSCEWTLREALHPEYFPLSAFQAKNRG